MENIAWKHYTVGFYFTSDLQKVLLIRKAKPQWQMGLLNGIGGSFEPEDFGNCVVCMDREFREETGYKESQEISWKKFAEGEIRVHQGDCFLHYMVGIGPDFTPSVVLNNEHCVWIHLGFGEELPFDIVPNLAFLIPMAKISLQKPWWSEVATFRTLI